LLGGGAEAVVAEEAAEADAGASPALQSSLIKALESERRVLTERLVAVTGELERWRGEYAAVRCDAQAARDWRPA